MGHTRLGRIPKTRKWTAIVAQMAGLGAGVPSSALSDDVAAIASRTLEAAEAALDRAITDPGLRYTFYLLTQVALSAREDEWPQALGRIGIQLSEEASVFDLTVEFQAAIDRHVSGYSRPSDFSEMAQQAGGEAIATLAASRAVTLFGAGRDELEVAIRAFSTKKGFAELGQQFFGRFMARFLNFYLSRITAAQVGGSRLRQVGEVSRFNEVLQTHCQQSARIVRDFCGEWYSKTEFKEGINLDNASRFVAVAMKKLRSEIEQQRAEA